MDDLAKRLSELLNSPEGMQKIQSVAASMGMLGNSPAAPELAPPAEMPPPPPPPEEASALSEGVDLSALSGLLGGGDMLGRLMPLLMNFKRDNNDTILLKALRPYLEEDRQHRLDESVKMLQLLQLLPLLKDKGGLL